MRRYAITFIAAFCAFLALVACINVLIDTNGVYRPDSLEARREIGRYVTRLRASTGGLVSLPRERNVKLELLRQTAAGCYVVGSSHAMQVDAATAPALFEHCRDVVNLGVSGAGFEDFVIMAGVLVERRFAGQLVVEAGPWMLRRNADPRWNEERIAYERGRELLGLPRIAGVSFTVDERWSGLINADYALHNVTALLQSRWPPAKQPEAASPPGWLDAREAGENDNVLLSNGRFEYARGFLKNTPPAPTAVKDGSYKIARPAIDNSVRIEFADALRALMRNGVRITLLLTPYHPAVFTCAGRNVCETLAEVETAVRALAEKTGVRLIGSFDPRPFTLTYKDFLDEMHVSKLAFNRIVATTNPWRKTNP